MNQIARELKIAAFGLVAFLVAMSMGAAYVLWVPIFLEVTVVNETAGDVSAISIDFADCSLAIPILAHNSGATVHGWCRPVGDLVVKQEGDTHGVQCAYVTPFQPRVLLKSLEVSVRIVSDFETRLSGHDVCIIKKNAI